MIDPKLQSSQEKADGKAGEEKIRKLIAQSLAGDTRAFEEIVKRNEAYVYRVCLTITRNQEDAEDAMQESFLKAFRSLGDFRGESAFRTWITRIAVNEALQKVRKRKSGESLDEMVETDEGFVPRQLEDWHPNPEQVYSAEEMGKVVEEAVLALAWPYRIVFVLRDLCHQGTAETAALLHLSTPAVKSRLLRARLMMREKLAERFRRPKPGKDLLRAAGHILRVLAERFCKALGLWPGGAAKK